MDRNRRTRGIVRSAVTRTLTPIDNLLQDENTTELDLPLQLDYLLQKESNLIHLDRDIQTSTSDDNLEDELEGAEEYRLRISHSLTHVRHALDSRLSVPQPTNIMPNFPLDRTQSGGLPPTPTSRSHQTVALLKLQGWMSRLATTLSSNIVFSCGAFLLTWNASDGKETDGSLVVGTAVVVVSGSPSPAASVLGITVARAVGTPRRRPLGRDHRRGDRLLDAGGVPHGGLQAADTIPAEAQGRLDNDVGVLIGSGFYWQVVTAHIQTIGILVAEKTELQSALSQSQQTTKQKTVETEELQGRLKAARDSQSQLQEKSSQDYLREIERLKTEQYKSSKSIVEKLKQELSELSKKLGKKAKDNEALTRAWQRAQASENAHSQLEELHQEKLEIEKKVNKFKDAMEQIAAEKRQMSSHYQSYVDWFSQQLETSKAMLEKRIPLTFPLRT
ncbi:hypothetical protein HPB47_003507 [Ixodes persulcatus]|uniref:Uncharacterized protein n=1 Tax=Ixodes persulcatus TaxID=34615 RepID=A0AC60PJA7_IXOPE|nr:hypothetical protein HPB47_003507 [Ixodes persulcatus]